MNIDTVDFFYLAMPTIKDIGDGSQDALLVRVTADGHVGWGECEAAPLVSIASWNCPMSHSACKPIAASVIGQKLETTEDIARINAEVRANSFDLLQADHTLSGIDIALWDLLGRHHDAPVWQLLGYERAYPKLAYASQLFGDNPQDTLRKARSVRDQGYRAAKFGWGPYGRGSAADDADQVRAAREGLGSAAMLLIDAGTVWGDDVESAVARLPALEETKTLWLEEPFVSGALRAYKDLAERSPTVRLAGGEGCHNYHQACNMIDMAGLGFVQIDAGRIGGITTTKQVADYAGARGVTFVNHTFTTPLALSASIQPYAGLEADQLCEYPVEATDLAARLTDRPVHPDSEGMIHLPDGPGLGLSPNLDTVCKYLVPVTIEVHGQTIYETPRM